MMQGHKSQQMQIGLKEKEQKISASIETQFYITLTLETSTKQKALERK